MLTPLITAFQASYPNVCVQVLVAERMADLIAEGVDLAFRLGELKDLSLVPRKIDLSASARSEPVRSQDCQGAELSGGPSRASLLTFANWKPEWRWTFIHKNGRDSEISMNDFAGLAPALAAGGGIGDLPPVVQPSFMREGQLVEVMPDWRFRTFDLSIIHVGNRHISKPCRLFREFAAQMTPALFPDLLT